MVKTKKVRTPCTCSQHAHGAKESFRPPNGPNITHTFSLEQNYETGYHRYYCSCGSTGRWQGQSTSVAYHSWLRHISKVFGWTITGIVPKDKVT